MDVVENSFSLLGIHFLDKIESSFLTFTKRKQENKIFFFTKPEGLYAFTWHFYLRRSRAGLGLLRDVLLLCLLLLLLLIFYKKLCIIIKTNSYKDLYKKLKILVVRKDPVQN